MLSPIFQDCDNNDDDLDYIFFLKRVLARGTSSQSLGSPSWAINIHQKAWEKQSKNMDRGVENATTNLRGSVQDAILKGVGVNLI